MPNDMPVIFEKKNTHIQSFTKCVKRGFAFVFSELLRLVAAITHPKVKQSRFQYRHCQFKSGGFTLLELLVVLTLLALVAGASVIALDGVDEDVAPQLAKSEMVEISKAIRQFKQDNLTYPPQPDNLPDYPANHPADFSPLFTCPYDDGVPPIEPACEYNPDTSRGWRGPYLAKQGTGFVDFAGLASPLENGIKIYAKSDPFKQYGAATTINWHQCGDYANANPADDDAVCVATAEGWGNPYLLIDLDGAQPRIVSMGSDGKYGGVYLIDPCLPNTADPAGKDDLVLCLK
jgi:prepilin-type N-terminal cleavage/methylation domain-containing protein